MLSLYSVRDLDIMKARFNKEESGEKRDDSN